ncbi:MAG: ABC transporter substrate-binding protein [Gammaproteobacteria bacterium]
MPLACNRNNGQGLLTCLIVAIAFACPSFTAVADTDSEADRVVEQLHQTLIEVMQASKKLGYKGRYARLYPVISSNFDTPLIVKVILSRYWKTLSNQQKSNFIQLFNHLSVATYASRFDAYDGEEFVEISKEKLKRGRLLIKTELRRPNEKPVKMNYLMRKKKDDWLIISVIAEGVNDLSLKRAEYAEVIKKKGFDGLVGDIQAKIRDMEKGDTGQ